MGGEGGREVEVGAWGRWMWVIRGGGGGKWGVTAGVWVSEWGGTEGGG